MDDLTDPRAALRAMWDRLESNGWTIRRRNLKQLDDRTVRSLAEDAARHIRVLDEGLAAGWRP